MGSSCTSSKETNTPIKKKFYKLNCELNEIEIDFQLPEGANIIAFSDQSLSSFIVLQCYSGYSVIKENKVIKNFKHEEKSKISKKIEFQNFFQKKNSEKNN